MNALKEKLRPYVAIGGLNAIVATEPGEDSVLSASDGVTKREAARFYGKGKNGGISEGTRFVFDTPEHMTEAKAKLNGKKFPEFPRNKLAFS